MSLASAAARGAASTLLAQWGKFVINIATIIILSRLLDAADFGLVAMVTAISGIALLLADFGLSMASIQNQDVSQAQKSNLFWINSLLGVLLAALLFLLSDPLADFYGHPEVAEIAKWIALIFVFNAATAQFRAEVTRKLRFTAMALIDVASQLVAFAIAVTLAVNGFGFWALVFQQIGMSVFQFVSLALVSRWFPGLPSRRAGVRSMLTFGVNSLGVQLVNYASNNADSVLVGRFVGADALGVYSRAYQLFRMPLQQLAAPTTRVAFPILSRLNGTPEYDVYIQRAQIVLTYLLGGVFFIAAVLANPIIEIALGPGWDQAKVVFYILAIGGVFQSMGYVYYWIFLSKAMTGLQLRYTIISRAIMLVLMAVGVLWGVYGVAAGVSAGLLLNWIILTVFAIPRTGVAVGPLVRAAARPLAVFFGLLLCTAPVILITASWDNPWSVLLVLVPCVALYLGLIVLVARPVRRDMVAIIDVVKRVRKRRGRR